MKSQLKPQLAFNLVKEAKGRNRRIELWRASPHHEDALFSPWWMVFHWFRDSPHTFKLYSGKPTTFAKESAAHKNFNHLQSIIHDQVGPRIFLATKEPTK